MPDKNMQPAPAQMMNRRLFLKMLGISSGSVMIAGRRQSLTAQIPAEKSGTELLYELDWSARPLVDPDDHPITYIYSPDEVRPSLDVYPGPRRYRHHPNSPDEVTLNLGVYPNPRRYWHHPYVYIPEMVIGVNTEEWIYQFQWPWYTPPTEETTFLGMANMYAPRGLFGGSFQLLYYVKRSGTTQWSYFGGLQADVASGPASYHSHRYPFWNAIVLQDGDALGIALKALIFDLSIPDDGVKADIW